MCKRILFVIFLCLFMFPLATQSQETSKKKKVWEDERIGMTLERMERADSCPEGLGFSGVPDKGNDFIIVYIAVVKVNQEVSISAFADSQLFAINLIDKEGNAYKSLGFSCAVGPEGGRITTGEGYMIFELPKGASPTRLQFKYPYREEKIDPKEVKFGQIDIELDK